MPCWDMVFAPESGEPRDSSSAAAIVACGLLEAAKYVDETEAAQWRTLARQMLGSLAAHYAVKPGTLAPANCSTALTAKKPPTTPAPRRAWMNARAGAIISTWRR